MDTSIVNSQMDSEGPEESIHHELMLVFYTEYKHFMDVFKSGLEEIENVDGDKTQGFKEIFRVFHTLKGDSAYFPEFSNFTKYVTEHCESVRNLSEENYNDQSLKKELHLHYAKLSSIFYASDLVGKPSLDHFRDFMINFN